VNHPQGIDKKGAAGKICFCKKNELARMTSQLSKNSRSVRVTEKTADERGAKKRHGGRERRGAKKRHDGPETSKNLAQPKLTVRSTDKDTRTDKPPGIRHRCQPKRLPQHVVPEQTRIPLRRARLEKASSSSLFYLRHI